MTQPEVNLASVIIMGREFKIKCPQNKLSELQKAADYLNNKMKEAQHSDKFASLDRLAIIAALNISHELTINKEKAAEIDSKHLANQLNELQQKITQTLANAG